MNKNKSKFIYIKIVNSLSINKINDYLLVNITFMIFIALLNKYIA